MALPNLSGSNIQDTFQRVLHTDGTSIFDGTGSIVLSSSNLTSLQTMNNNTISEGDWGYVETMDQHVNSTASVLFTNITASGDISSSGTINAAAYLSNGYKLWYRESADAPITSGQGGDTPILVSHITASGNISSSGTIQGANLIAASLKNNNNENLIRYHAGSDSVRVGIHTDNTHPLSLQGHVTASGNISSSGYLYGNNATIANTIYLGGENRIDYNNDDIRFQDTGIDVAGNITASGNISASGEIQFNNIKGGTF